MHSLLIKALSGTGLLPRQHLACRFRPDNIWSSVSVCCNKLKLTMWYIHFLSKEEKITLSKVIDNYF